MRLLDRVPIHRFAVGDPGELRRWSQAVRAVVQRLALPESPRVTCDPRDGALLREDGSRMGTLRWHDAGTAHGAVVVHCADGVAADLHDRGFATLSLDIAPAEDAEALLLHGRSPLAALTDDMLAAVRWARDRFGKVGLYGEGDGAAVALHTALLADEPLPLAAAGHGGSYTQLGMPALPGILRYADLPDLYAALAPRPLLLPEPPQAVRDAYKAFDATGVLSDGGTAAGFFRDAFRRGADAPPVPPLRVHFDVGARLEVADRMDQILASGMLTQGRVVAEFEESAARHTGAETVAVSSGTAALDIAYQLLDVRGRTVLVPVNTFFATAASVDRVGGRVEFVDMELDGLGMDPEALREALGRCEDVAAVVIVHIGGVVAPSVKEILLECAARGIPVVEDAAHALGSRLGGELAGAFGDVATFSLHPAKVATSGEGGLLTARDPGHLHAARGLRDHGKVSADRNIHDRLGNNWRLSEPHAAVGLAHLSRLDAQLAARRALAARYDERLAQVPRLRPYVVEAGVQSNYYKYLAFLDPEVDRAELKARLRQRHGVALAGEVYDVLLSEQPYYAARGVAGDFEKARWFARHHVCLPVFPTMSTADQDRVVEALVAELS